MLNFPLRALGDGGSFCLINCHDAETILTRSMLNISYDRLKNVFWMI